MTMSCGTGSLQEAYSDAFLKPVSLDQLTEFLGTFTESVLVSPLFLVNFP